ncbi:MAG TPA: iron-sulfur cluster assembly accessory protein [Burkholderiales bacterium]|nr:iron-sulfur cluster assembly accessory protein [Burkholderiales bacterium]
MAITVTERAAKHIKNALARGGGVGLRLGVKTVGCSGLAYTFDYATEVKPEDTLFESNEVKVVVDAKSLPYLDGSVLDFERKGLNESFKIANPNATATCGCGESFSVG